MNTLEKNIDRLAHAATAFVILVGIDTEEYLDATCGLIFNSVNEYYEEKGIVFDIKTMEIEDGAMGKAFEKLSEILVIAQLAVSAGITPKDLGL